MKNHTITISLPLQHVNQRTAIEVHKEMLRRSPETLRGAPEVVAKQFHEVLKAGEKLKRGSSADITYWARCMHHLEEVLSLVCTYDLKRWLSAFGGLRLILEKEARKRSREQRPGDIARDCAFYGGNFLSREVRRPQSRDCSQHRYL